MCVVGLVLDGTVQDLTAECSAAITMVAAAEGNLPEVVMHARPWQRFSCRAASRTHMFVPKIYSPKIGGDDKGYTTQTEGYTTQADPCSRIADAWSASGPTKPITYQFASSSNKPALAGQTVC